MKLKYSALLAAFSVSAVHASDIVITGVIDATLTGGTPKAIEIFVINDIANLSTCGVGAANNGGGTDGEEITFNPGVATAGTYIYVASESTQFTNFFGFAPDYTGNGANINGDDAIELFCNGVVVDVFGDINIDGNGEAWEYLNGWAARVADTGPDGSTFELASWSFSGVNALNGQTTNASATTPYPLKSYADEVDGGGGGGAGGGGGDDGICTNCPDVLKVADASTFSDPAYYESVMTEVDASADGLFIKMALTEVISENVNSLTYTQAWTVLTESDQDPVDSDNVILLYSGKSIPKNQNASGQFANEDDFWNREHVWPNSHGFADDGDRNQPPELEAFSDVHHLRPTDRSINNSRGNLDFDESDGPLAEAPANSVDGDSFEPRDEVKGDVARMMLYMDTRYEGITDNTPNLVLVDELTNSGDPRLGKLCTLLAWHANDPVSEFEQNRNNVLYEYQGNRNPYVDHPEWVELIYTADACSDDDGGGDDGDGDTGGVSTLVFINEFHYDNTGADTGEAIEIAGLAGTDLSVLRLVLYNGNNGASYNTISLSGVLPNQQNGFGTFTLDLPSNGLQNGAPDGIALVDATDNVLQFLSYEGTMDATNGPAVGMTSQDVGVSEPGSTPVGHSLQLSGTGSSYEDFVWVAAAINTFSQVNTEQNFVAPAPFINEIHYDNTGGDTGEAIEVAGVAGTDLSTFSLVLYNGNNGTAYDTVMLSGVLTDQQSGFGTASFDISGIQNGAPDGIALVDATNNVLQFLSYEGTMDATDGPAVGMTSQDIGVSEPGSTPVGHSLQLAGSGVKSSDFIWEAPAANTFGTVNTNQTFAGGGDDGGGEGPGECCEETTFIHDVQGSGDASPLVGDTVLIEGIVSASFADGSGFFIQEESADMDSDPSTSEGVFVAYSGELPAVGSLVSVIGAVSESFGRTQLTATDAPEIISTETEGAQAFALTLPFVDAAEAETLEGMLVFTSQALVVTDNFTLGRFGQVTLSTERLFIPTNVFAPGSDEAIALEASNTLNRIMLDDGDSTQNPEVVAFPTGGLSASNTLRLGDTIASLTGVVDFAFGDYRVIPTQDPTFVATNPRTAEPDLNLGNLKVASLNVLNYFNNIDDSGSICGPTASSSCRGADSVLEFERQKAKTVAAIVAMDADIMGLMEIENNGFSEGSAIADLVAGINAVMGAGTYSIVDPGAAIGSDAITVAFMYKPSVVSLAGAPQILDSSNSISDEDGVLFIDTKNRPSLVQEFALVENGETLVISVNHLKSKGSGCGVGDDDTTTGQGSCNLTRTRAAQALTAFLETQFPDKATLIIGDLNAYAKEDPISALENAGFTNLISEFNGQEAYSYSFRGLIGYLDHALANDKALANVIDVVEWHINADEPISLDYNVEFKTPDNVNNYYADDAYRMSDHDPVIVSLNLKADLVIGDYDGDGDLDRVDLRAMIVALRSGEVLNPAFDVDGNGIVTVRDVLSLIRQCTRARCATE
jgi:predicted extracellular nuclease/endonuclease I